MIVYGMPCGWSISLPDNWVFETDEEQSVFYPSDSDLTVRITPFHALKQGEPAPVEAMQEVFLWSISDKLSPAQNDPPFLENFSAMVFKGTYEENGENVFWTAAGLTAPGELLSVNIFGSSEAECDNALAFLKNLKRERTPTEKNIKAK